MCARARAGGGAGFLEQQALRSLAGGNVAAAVHRLGLCKDALLEESRASGYTPELCCRLGEVIGTQVRQHACTLACADLNTRLSQEADPAKSLCTFRCASWCWQQCV